MKDKGGCSHPFGFQEVPRALRGLRHTYCPMGLPQGSAEAGGAHPMPQAGGAQHRQSPEIPHGYSLPGSLSCSLRLLLFRVLEHTTCLQRLSFGRSQLCL